MKRTGSRVVVIIAMTIAFVLGSLSWAQGATHALPDAGSIVKRADQIRFPSHDFEVDVTITTLIPEREPEVRKYRVLSKGNNRTLVLTTAPPIDRGQIMLMRDHDLWIYLPSVSQPVRLPLSHRLTGQVANGDIARAKFSGDYNAKLLRTESVDGEAYYVLELIAAGRGVTYHRVLYWVNQRNYRPHKAEFYTVSGRLLKRANYGHFAKLGDAVRPTKLVLENTLRTGERSIMEYTNMQHRDLPDKVFTKNYLKKLQ